MVIKESAENYLEAILMIKNEKGTVRSVDIASHLNVSKPSVSVAMKNFRKDGYIRMDEDSEITLTKKGLKIAARIFERHRVIAKALISLGVDVDTAYEDSCKIEHDISDISFEKIKEYLARNSIDY